MQHTQERKDTAQEKRNLCRSDGRGKLKIFFGYAPGVGKTYAMLQAARRAHQEGVDVVVGCIEQHTQADTLALIEGLEKLPGMQQGKFDMEAAVKRKPQLLLVEDLSHVNPPDSVHQLRYQDIKDLLKLGITVYTTVDVQHLASLQDAVNKISSRMTKSCIPDYIFDMADSVELVDMEPDDLLARMQKEGSQEHLPTRQQLTALRSLALRRAADRLGHIARRISGESGIQIDEHVLVCLSGSPTNATVIRTAARMAEAFQGDLTALFVETAATSQWQGQTLQRLQDHVHLAEQLGARIATVYGEDPAEQIAQYAQVSGTTKIVMGRAGGRQSGNTLADRLIRQAIDADIYIIPDHMTYHQQINGLQWCRSDISGKDLARMIIVMAVALLLGWYAVQMGANATVPALLYLVGVMITAAWTGGKLCGIFASVVGMLCYNFLFIPPLSSFHAVDPIDVVTLLVILFSGLGVTFLLLYIKGYARQEIQKSRYAQVLLKAVQAMTQSCDDSDLLYHAAQQVSQFLKRPVLYAMDKETVGFRVFPSEMEEGQLPMYETKQEHRAARRAMDHPDVQRLEEPAAGEWCMYLPISDGQRTLGVIGIPVQGEQKLTLFEKNLLVSIAAQCGQMMGRVNKKC